MTIHQTSTTPPAAGTPTMRGATARQEPPRISISAGDSFAGTTSSTVTSPYRPADFPSTVSSAALNYVDSTIEESPGERANVFIRATASLFVITSTVLPALFAAAPAVAYELKSPPASLSMTMERVAQPEELSYVRDDVPSTVATGSYVRKVDTKELGLIQDKLAASTRVEQSLLEAPLRKGMSGDKVKKLQQGLNHFVKVKATGVFDDATETAVKAFQKSNGVVDDGVVGNRTYGVLWTRCFWEKGVALDINGADFYKTLPKNLKVRADLSEQRVHLVDKDSGQTVRSYPMSSGAQGFETPMGTFRITEIREKPSWYPPPSPWAKGAKVERPGKENPLGPVFMRLDGSTILLHGSPARNFGSLGSYPASHGCMRMFPQDAWELHRIVKNGTTVEVVK